MNARGVDGDHLYRGVDPSRPTAGRMSAVSPAGPPPEAGGVEAATLTVGSLFSGIGGLDLGLERAGMTVRWQSEIDPYCCRVLNKHWPHVPNLGDVTTIDWSRVEPVDVICGGYPCQPVSQAGLQRYLDDPRWLWPAFATALRELRPRYALLENVGAHLRLGFDTVLADLASFGFDAEWSIVSACAVGASHTRERLFVLAYSTGDDGQGEGSHHSRSGQIGGFEPRGGSGSSWSDWWLSEPDVDRVAHGVPRRLVEPALRAVGNAVVPQIAEWVGRRIIAADFQADVARLAALVEADAP